MASAVTINDVKYAVALRERMIAEADVAGADRIDVSVSAEKVIVLAARMWLQAEEQRKGKAK